MTATNENYYASVPEHRAFGEDAPNIRQPLMDRLIKLALLAGLTAGNIQLAIGRAKQSEKDEQHARVVEQRERDKDCAIGNVKDYLKRITIELSDYDAAYQNKDKEKLIPLIADHNKLHQGNGVFQVQHLLKHDFMAPNHFQWHPVDKNFELVKHENVGILQNKALNALRLLDSIVTKPAPDMRRRVPKPRQEAQFVRPTPDVLHDASANLADIASELIAHGRPERIAEEQYKETIKNLLIASAELLAMEKAYAIDLIAR